VGDCGFIALVPLRNVKAAVYRPIPSWPLSCARVGSDRCPILRSGRRYFSTPARRSPLLLELARRQVAECRVDAFDVVDVVEEAAQLPRSVGEVVVFGEVHLLLGWYA
jgi:hypothetical protein